MVYLERFHPPRIVSQLRRIQLIQQPGHHPVQGLSPDRKVSKRRNEAKELNEDPIRGRLFALAKWETITLHVSFVPEEVPAADWHHYLTRHEHVFRGDLIVEYPRETSGESATHKELLMAAYGCGAATAELPDSSRFM